MVIKKTFVLLCSACFLLLALCSCGEDQNNSEIAGHWVPTTATLNGSSVNYSELDLEDDYFSLTFNSDGTCTATLTGIEGSGTYVFNGTSVDITINGDTQRLTYENSQLTLTLSYDGNTSSFVFAKEK